MDSSYYRHHVFFCTNQRDDGAPCCQDRDAQGMRDYMKKRCKKLDLTGPGKVRVNTAGCMDRCADGPLLVIYPQAVWYNWVDKSDIDEIIDQHLQQGRIVERLRLK